MGGEAAVIYEYRCQQWGGLFEVHATLVEKESGLHPRCPSCGSEQTVRRFTGVSVLRGGRAAGAPGSWGGCCPGGGTTGRGGMSRTGSWWSTNTRNT